MDIRVSGHQVDTGEALREHVETRLQGVAEKYFARAISAQVTFSKGPHDYRFDCDIVAHINQGVILKARGEGGEAHPAFDEAAAKIEKQLRRYVRRLKDRQTVSAGEAAAIMMDAGYTIFQGGNDDDEEEAADNPLVVAETRVDIPDASVSDAVMMLDLRSTNALLFKNSVSGTFNMVYRRNDGTIGWVEPQRTA